METTKLYALIPLFNISTPKIKQSLSIHSKSTNAQEKQKLDRLENLKKQIDLHIRNILKIKNKPNYTLHELKKGQNNLSEQKKQPCSYAVLFSQFNLTFEQLNQIVTLYQQISPKLNFYEETLKDFDWDKHALEQSSHDNHVNDTQNVQSLLKRAKKYKQIKQENKKLKKLLQIQLDNTQKVREETQKTMKILRNQFNALVAQMVKERQKNEKSIFNEQISGIQENALDKSNSKSN